MSASINAPRFGVIILIIVALIAAYMFLAAPDKRNGFERIGDAIHELPNGGNAAADQLKDRTPAQKAGDAIENAGENLKRNVNGK